MSFIDDPNSTYLLSYTWEEEEVTFEHLKQLQTATALKGLQRKVLFFANQAKANGFWYI